MTHAWRRAAFIAAFLVSPVAVLNQSDSQVGGISASTIGVDVWPLARRYLTRGTVLAATVAASMFGKQSSTITAASSVTRHL